MHIHLLVCNCYVISLLIMFAYIFYGKNLQICLKCLNYFIKTKSAFLSANMFQLLVEVSIERKDCNIAINQNHFTYVKSQNLWFNNIYN